MKMVMIYTFYMLDIFHYIYIYVRLILKKTFNMIKDKKLICFLLLIFFNHKNKMNLSDFEESIKLRLSDKILFKNSIKQGDPKKIYVII